MWKALIKLIEKWAYRCEHDWELVTKVNVREKSIGITGYEFIYRCKKCCKSKIIKT